MKFVERSSKKFKESNIRKPLRQTKKTKKDQKVSLVPGTVGVGVGVRVSTGATVGTGRKQSATCVDDQQLRYYETPSKSKKGYYQMHYLPQSGGQ